MVLGHDIKLQSLMLLDTPYKNTTAVRRYKLTFPSAIVLKQALSMVSAYELSFIWRNIMTPLNNNAVGFALSCPSISGAVPCT